MSNILMNNYKLSLIITTYNQPEFLNFTLASLTNQSLKGFEIIIADDGSDKRTFDIIKKYSHLNIHHKWHPDRGYRKSLILNKAVKETKSDYLVFIDNDCILHKDFLNYHYHYKAPGYLLNGRRVILGPKFTNDLTIEKVRSGYLDKINLDLLKSCCKKDSRHFHRSIPIKNKIIRKLAGWDKINDIRGSNFSLFRNDLIRVNGFNNDLKNYWGEDGDLFIRFRNSRLKIKSIKNLAVQYHLYHKRRNPDQKVMKWYYDALENNFTYSICKNGAKKIDRTDNIEVSLILPTFNQLEYTKRCIKSIYKNTSVKFEIIVIDNGSNDSTPEYLKQLRKKYSNLRIILNKTNKGCARAWNKGIKLARADYIAILNNDIIVTPRWLKNLIKFSIEKNYLFVGPAYKEGKLDYDIEIFYKYFIHKNKNRERKSTYTGFAMLFYKSIFDKVGFFSTEYKRGTYEDVDFIMKLKKNNIAFSTTGSSFIHHFRSKTQDYIRATEGNKYEFINRDTFQNKWRVKTVKGISEPKNKLHKEYIKLKNWLNIW